MTFHHSLKAHFHCKQISTCTITNGARETTYNGNNIVRIGKEESNRTYWIAVGLKSAGEEDLAIYARKFVKYGLYAEEGLAFNGKLVNMG